MTVAVMPWTATELIKPLVESHQQFLDQESKANQDQARTLVQMSTVMQEQTRLLADMQKTHEAQMRMLQEIANTLQQRKAGGE